MRQLRSSTVRKPVIIAGVFGVAVGLGLSLGASHLLTSETAATRGARPPEASEAELRVKEAKLHDDLLRAHRAEPVDPAWSKAEHDALVAALAPLTATKGLVATEVECRSTSCVLTSHWSDYDAASNSVPRLLRPRVPNARTETFLAEPANRAAPYQSDVVYIFRRGAG
jgi:hypothetical protein